jgi:hypothetical protein
MENNGSGVSRGLPAIQVTELCFEGSILCTNSIPKINYEKDKIMQKEQCIKYFSASSQHQKKVLFLPKMSSDSSQITYHLLQKKYKPKLAITRTNMEFQK